MLKTFLAGIALGVVAAAAAVYAFPAVDVYREASIISVAANGGNREAFHINVPMDRIMVGAPGQARTVPDGLDWPRDEVLATVRAELFKIRNERDAVVGVASRIAAKSDDKDVIEWVLHLPARGSMYVTMDPTPREGGFRLGELRQGAREFAPLTGVLTERWVVDTSGEEDAPAGRIELMASYVGQPESLQ